MKTLNLTFDDEEYQLLSRARLSIPNKSWEKFFLEVIKQVILKEIEKEENGSR